MKQRDFGSWMIWLLAAALFVAAAASLLLGRYPAHWMPLSRLAEDALARQFVLNLRLPRVLMAVMLGMSLSGGGAVMQRLFRNPLVDPGFLGVSGGAAFGAALAIWLGAGTAFVVEASASGFALLGLGGSCLLAKHLHVGGWVLRLVLAGIVVSAFFSAGLGLIKSLADPLHTLPELTFWLLGGLWGVTWADVQRVWPVLVPALAILWLMRWRTALLALDDHTVFSLGVRAGRERLVVLVASAAAVAAVVSVCGAVGWLGLIVPHIARRLPGVDARSLVPAAMLLGGLLALVCDNVARVAVAGEIPIGILTSLLGAGVFLLILIRSHPRLGGDNP